MSLTFSIAVAQGHITREPYHRVLSGGRQTCKLTLAVDGRGRHSNKASFIDVLLQGKLVEKLKCGDMIGTLVRVEGYLQTDSWESVDGKKAFKMQIVGKELRVLIPAKTSLVNRRTTGSGTDAA